MLKIISFSVLGILCFAVLVMHLLCAFFSNLGDSRKKLLEYVNVVFHVLLLVPLFMLKYEIEIAVLFFMASVFLHTVFGAIASKLYAKKVEEEVGDDGDGSQPQPAEVKEDGKGVGEVNV